MANLLENPGFETDTSNPPAKWSNFNSPANVTRGAVNTASHSGSNSWKVSTTDGSTADCGLQQSEFSGRTGTITVVPNTTYYYSSYVKTALTTGQVHTHIKVFTAGYGSESGYDTSDVTGTNDWTLNDKTFTTGASDVICEIWLCFGAYGSAANGDAWFDDISLDVPTPPSSASIKSMLGHGFIPSPR